MKNEDMEKLSKSIQEKLGTENAGLIADDLAKIVTENAQMNSLIENKDTKIDKLEKDKENLINSNGNLLQQITAGITSSFSDSKPNNKQDNKENELDNFIFADAFDERGRFKK